MKVKYHVYNTKNLGKSAIERLSKELEDKINSEIDLVGYCAANVSATYSGSNRKMEYLVDISAFSNTPSRHARVLGYSPGSSSLYMTNGRFSTKYFLRKPLEEMSLEELKSLSDDGGHSLIRLDMIKKLKRIVSRKRK